MALIHKSGCECLLSSLELFTIPPTQASIDRTVFNRYFPLTSLERGPIEFRITSSEFEYLDLNNIYLYTKSRILDGKGNPISPTIVKNGDTEFNSKGVVVPVNNFHSSRFKTIEVYLNNQQVNETDNMYPYRSLLETLLSYNKGAKETMCKMLLFSKDISPDNNFEDLGSENETELTEKVNPGAWFRFQATKFSAPFETMGKLHSEIFSQERFLPSNTDLRIRFHRAEPSFCLMAADATKNYTIVIDSAMLLVRHVDIPSSIREAHAKAALTKNYIFPVRKVKSLFFTHSSGRQDLSVHNMVTGKLPRRIVVGFVKSSSFHGDLSTSPFNFQNFDIKSIILRVGGYSLPVENGYELDFPRRNFLQGYFSLLQGSTNLFTNGDIDIDPYLDYADGCTLFSFDISPEMESGSTDKFDLIRDGNIDIEVKLGTPTTFSVTMIAHLEYDHLIQMTKDGDIVSDP